jgi:hypothetical protein
VDNRSPPDIRSIVPNGCSTGRGIITLFDVLVRHQHQCHVIAACHAGEADIAPSPAATRHPV